MNRKKRKASAGRATNAKQKSSTVEVGEMVTMDQGGTSAVHLDEAGELLHYRQLAWLLREKLNDFVDGDQGEPPGLELQSLLNLATSRKIISVDPKLLNPVLWRTLPKELLMLVLARLPLPDVTRLCSLSKVWNRDMATVDSEIHQALEERSPIVLVGFLKRAGSIYSAPEFLVTVCIERSPYSYRLHPGDPIIHGDRWDDMGAVDGGLACFVSTWRPSKANPLCIVVVNLLTRVWRKLPPRQHVYLSPPQMMHIKVDSTSKSYKVVVVDENRRLRSVAEIYDSRSRQWTKATPPLGSIFGLSHGWCFFADNFRSFSSGDITPCMYDFAKGKLKRCHDFMGPSQGASVITHAVRKDCMFVLHKNTSHGEILAVEGCCITKYRLQSNAKDWNAERSYLCSPFEGLLEEDLDSMSLEACEDFLMVFSDAFGNGRRFWLLDLSTGDWRISPNHLEGCFQGHVYGTFTMTRASWNVVP